MKFLTYSECEQWCNTNGYATEIDSYERPKPYFELHKEYGLPLEYPTHSGHKVALARTVVKFLLAQSGGLLWITGWSVWPFK